MSTTPKRSNDGIIGTPAAKRPSTNTATSVSDVEWDELVFGKPFANRYDGFHVGFGFGDERSRLTLQITKPPDTVRAPFEPKVHTAGGGGGGTDKGSSDPSFVIELNDASHTKMLAFETKVKDTAVAKRDDWFPKGKHAPTARPAALGLQVVDQGGQRRQGLATHAANRHLEEFATHDPAH